MIYPTDNTTSEQGPQMRWKK